MANAQQYEDMRKEDLVNLAQEMGLEVNGGMRKAELVKLISTAEAKTDAEGLATEDEPFATVRFVGDPGLIADDLLPYQEDQAELVPDQEYSAPESLVRRLLLNRNFEAADNRAEELLDEERSKSNNGVLRARRLLAAPAESGESVHAFDRRVGIEDDNANRISAIVGRSFEPERPEFDPDEAPEFTAEAEPEEDPYELNEADQREEQSDEEGAQ